MHTLIYKVHKYIFPHLLRHTLTQCAIENNGTLQCLGSNDENHTRISYMKICMYIYIHAHKCTHVSIRCTHIFVYI